MTAQQALVLFANMILQKLAVACDLSESSYEVASDGLLNPLLQVALEDVPYAEQLRVPYAINMRLIKGTWLVIGDNGGRFSPGVY